MCHLIPSNSFLFQLEVMNSQKKIRICLTHYIIFQIFMYFSSQVRGIFEKLNHAPMLSLILLISLPYWLDYRWSRLFQLSLGFIIPIYWIRGLANYYIPWFIINVLHDLDPLTVLEVDQGFNDDPVADCSKCWRNHTIRYIFWVFSSRWLEWGRDRCLFVHSLIKHQFIGLRVDSYILCKCF